MKSRFTLLALMALLAVVLGFWAFPPHTGVRLLIDIGYGVTLVSFGWFLFYVWKVVRPERARLIAEFKNGGWKIVTVALGLSVFLHLHEKHEYKVVMDEVVLMATSQGMYKERDATYAGRAYTLGPDFHILQRQMDKRPLFFPFLVSLVHDLTGYRTTNSFWLNGLLTPILFGLIYAVARRLAGVGAGVVAMALWATIPLFTHCATGGGFELLNLVMIAATTLLGMRYAEKPTGDSLAAFCLSGVLLAQVRYESVLFIVPVAVVVLLAWKKNRPTELPWAVMILPLLLIPYALHRYVLQLNPMLWQLSDRPSAHGSFSFHYFYDNIGHALNYFFTFDFTQPSSALVAVAGLFALAFFPLWLWRKGLKEAMDQPSRMAFLVFVGALMAMSLFMLCYFWGAFDDPLTTRLSLPTQLLLVWLSVLLLPEFTKGREVAWRVVGGLTVAYMIFWTMPVLSKQVYTSDQSAPHLANWVGDFVKMHKNLKQSLVVDSRALIVWLTNGVPSVTHEAIIGNRDGFLFHYKNQTFNQILVVQRFHPRSFSGGEWAVAVGDDLGPGVGLETVDQVVMGPMTMARISRVTQVDEELFLATAESYSQRVTENAKPAENLSELQRQQKEYIGRWLKNLP